jgi:Tol biopolymer transport system component
MLATDGASDPIQVFSDSDEFFASDCRFSPDGTRIAYTRDFKFDVYIRDLATGADTRVTFTEGNARSPDWDPTGERIVYQRIFRDVGAPESTFAIHIVDLSTLSEHALLANGVAVGGSDPRWSPDGTQIALATGTHLSATDSTRMASHIWVARVDGSSTRDLTPGDVRNNLYPEWSSAGALIFESFDPRGYRWHSTHTISSDGSGRTVLPVDVMPYIEFAALAPEANRFVFTGPDSAGEWGVLVLQNLDDGAGVTRRQLTTYEPPYGSLMPGRIAVQRVPRRGGAGLELLRCNPLHDQLPPRQ